MNQDQMLFSCRLFTIGFSEIEYKTISYFSFEYILRYPLGVPEVYYDGGFPLSWFIWFDLDLVFTFYLVKWHPIGLEIFNNLNNDMYSFKFYQIW